MLLKSVGFNKVFVKLKIESKMKKGMFNHANSYAQFIARIFLALVIFPHGAQKLLGWFGGYGFAATMQYFTENQQLPWIVGLLVIIIEFFGPLFLIVGYATRLWSLAISVVMIGVVCTNFNRYFFMNWFGNQPAEGYEFFLLAIGLSFSIAVSGAGKVSLYYLLHNNYKRKV